MKMTEHMLPCDGRFSSRRSRTGGRICGQLGKSSLLLAFGAFLVSCASQQVVTTAVGPRPLGWSSAALPPGNGQLQVFTETDEYEFDHDVPFFPHRDYRIYTTDGKYLRRVWNAQSHEDETPALVNLAAGKYLVKGDAAFYGPVTITVAIRPNEVTRVILQPGWTPPNTVARSELVQMPNGYYIGWRADLAEKK